MVYITARNRYSSYTFGFNNWHCFYFILSTTIKLNIKLSACMPWRRTWVWSYTSTRAWLQLQALTALTRKEIHNTNWLLSYESSSVDMDTLEDRKYLAWRQRKQNFSVYLLVASSLLRNRNKDKICTTICVPYFYITVLWNFEFP